ncbi:MAG TPA: protein kinase [Candidatus Dormibacteraeota bacterium]|nr:protein kinase [Candidatus Dormibacteraeota bacterium]
MTPERWQQIKKVLEVALALDTAERGPYLDKTCANDADLRQEVESLLASHQPTGKNILDEPLANILAAEPAPARHAMGTGQRIGAYKIIEEIGRGGMGEVYRAVRADGEFTKEVALKTVRGGFDVASVVERFRNERQILASLDHPNIARLYDGGTSDEGIPYLVMELVDGVLIDSYCDADKLNITRRLELFVQVCSAVQYAHQRLVIHRDIKPGNILVTKEGVPKLLDFGIAKILDPATTMNVTLVRPMTPEYASPEQIRGEPITTASDVYSLGVVLYQLLAGRSPYRTETRTRHELSEAITNTEPERPSTAILRRIPSDGADRGKRTAEQLCDVREGSLSKLQKRLAGDLDNIVLKALRKEPQRRYSSVEQLAEDLRKHLDGRPVSARKDSWSYRSGKFIRRHKVGVTASALAAAMLVAGVVVTLREARIAENNRLRAEKRFDDVRKLSNSLIFEIHDSIQNLQGATPARKLLLDRALEYLDKLSADASGDPDLQRELAWGYQRLAVVQGNSEESNLGNVKAALASDHKALSLFEAVAKANPSNTIDQLNVAMMHRILSFSELSGASGREDLEKAMEISGCLLKTDGQNPKVKSERSIEYQNLALMYSAKGDRPHALESYQENLKLKENILRANPDYRGIVRAHAMATGQLGDELAQEGQRKESLAALDKAILGFEEAIKSGAPPDVAREAAVARIKKCNVQLMESDIADALESLREASQTILPMAKLDPENTMLRSDAIGLEFERGVILTLQGKYASAVETLQVAFKKYEASGVSSEDPPGKGAFHMWLGEAEMGRRDFKVALQHFQKATMELAVPEGKAIHDDFRCQLAESHVKTGRALLSLGKMQEASTEFQEALETITPSLVTALQDVPAYYAAADGYAGLGDARLRETRSAKSDDERSKLIANARDFYVKSVEYWQKIPNPSRVSPSVFVVKSEGEVARSLARCKAELAGN